METHDQRDLRSATRRQDKRRQEIPDSAKAFLAWVMPEERRELDDRRGDDRRSTC